MRVVQQGFVEGRAQVVEIGLVAFDEGFLGQEPGVVPGLLEMLAQDARVACPHGRAFAGFGQLGEREQAAGFEQPVARRLAGIDGEERAVDQLGQQVDAIHRVEAGHRDHAHRHLEREAAREDAELAERRLLLGAEQAMAPVHGCAERLLARGRGAAEGAQQAKALVEPGRHAADAEQRATRRRQLDGQRRAVELAAELEHGGDVVVVDAGAPVGRLQALVEQGDRAERQRLGSAGLAGTLRHVEAAEPEDALVRHAQGHLAGHQHVQGRGRLDEGFGDGGHGVDQVLGVVEQQQRIERSHGGEQRGQGIAIGRDRHLQGVRHGAGDQRRIGQRGQLDRGHAVGVALAQGPEGVGGQARLADAAGAGDGDQPVRTDERQQGGAVVRAAHQRQRGHPGVRATGSGGRWPRCRSRRFRVIEREREAIAAARNGRDGGRAQHLAQGRHVHVQVRFLDDGAAPHGVEQLVLADETAGSLEQGDQKIEGAPAEGDGAAFDAKPAFGGVDFDATKSEIARHAVCG